MGSIAKLNEKEKVLVCQELREAIGSNKVKDDENVLATYGFDSSRVLFQKPSFVVLPENTEDVKQVLKIANRHIIPVTVMSGGVNIVGLCIPADGGIVLDLRRMDKIIEINTDSGYAVIEPGVIFDKFTAALAEKGFRCQVPTSPGGSTPLGNYLMRPSGSLTTRHLDPILDLEVVSPNGIVMSTGSSHFPSAGGSMRYGPFPDLAGLFCCSYGTLGVVTKATVRIYPINESNRVVLAAFDSYESSSKYTKDIINHNICEHCLIWSWQLYRTYEITYSTDWVPEVPLELMGNPLKPPKGIPYNVVTTLMSGYEEAMIVNEKLCEKVARKYGGRIISRKEAEDIMPGALYQWEQHYLGYHQVMSKTFGTGRYMAYLVMAEPQAICHLEPWAVKKLASLGVAPVGYYSMPFDFGRSMFFRMFIYPDPQNEELLSKTAATLEEMHQEAMRRYGAIPFRYRPGLPWLKQTGEYYHFLKKVKQEVDPNNVLNPHLGLF